jgi:hypothetical protein
VNVPREKILVCIPTFDFKVESELMLGLLSCTPYFSTMPMLYGGNSAVQLARNALAHHFVEQRPECDWLMWIDADTVFTKADWELLWEGDELIVCAEYARKLLGAMPVKGGMGFMRVHRSVFEQMKELTTEDGQDRIPRYLHDGKLVVDYHSCGVMQNGEWVGEDRGFLLWAASLNISVRWETRTRLGHAGRFVYGYPDQIPGFKFMDADEGAAQ